MKYFIGQKVKVAGRPEWHIETGWDRWKRQIGKVGVVKEVGYNIIYVYIDGHRWGLYKESIKPINYQLEFEFMNERV